jgi:glycosyltransferase involved in cell wall biosynthesis
MLSRHPSYQPLEFMASGMATVTNRNEDNLWLLRDGVNCLLSEPSPSAMAERIGELICNDDLRMSIARKGHEEVSSRNWESEIDAIWRQIEQRW